MTISRSIRAAIFRFFSGSPGWNKAFRACEIFSAGSVVLFTAATASSRFREFIQANWWVPFPLWMIGLAAAWFRRATQKYTTELTRVDRQRELHWLVSSVIKGMRRSCLTIKDCTEPETHHRLTVFRLNEAKDRLEPYSRSCESTGDSQRYWEFSFADEDGCQGLAGFSAHVGVGIGIPGKKEAPLPSVGPDATLTEAAVKDYATRTRVSEEMVRACRWRARSYASMPIKLLSGGLWGVLILDSTNKKAPETRNSLWATIQEIATMLGKMISEFEDSTWSAGMEDQ